jgi:hypothetical protein
MYLRTVRNITTLPWSEIPLGLSNKWEYCEITHMSHLTWSIEKLV